jgi:hypothetical protein
MDALEGS